MRLWLVMQTSDGGERPFLVHRNPTIIGREARCDLRVPVPSVLPRHCELRLGDGGWVVAGIDPASPPLVNDLPIVIGPLEIGDTLTIGPVRFAVRLAGDGRDFEAITETKPVVQAQDGVDRSPAV